MRLWEEPPTPGRSRWPACERVLRESRSRHLHCSLSCPGSGLDTRPVPEAPASSVRLLPMGRAKQSFADKRVPKLELRNEGKSSRKERPGSCAQLDRLESQIGALRVQGRDWRSRSWKRWLLRQEAASDSNLSNRTNQQSAMERQLHQRPETAESNQRPRGLASHQSTG